jgi:hypothetical protein
MPAVTADTLTLPRIPEPVAGAVERPVSGVHNAPSGVEGEGFPVRRAFAGVPLEVLDPFIHMDQMGAVDYGPGEPRGTDWHPHRGFETVTYMLDGTFQHQDSQGGGGVISDGATQWMTAGQGILHIETPPEALVRSGGLFHGLQLWVNLPAADKLAAPRYQSLEGDQAALLSSADGGALVRIIAGEVGGHAGPGATHTPITFLHATVAPGARLHLPWRAEFNALAYVLSGSGRAGSEARPIGTGDLVVFAGSQVKPPSAGDHLLLGADDSGASPASRRQTASPNLEVVVLGGRPIREPLAWYGPFVMNTRAEVLQAVEDYQAGRLGAVPVDGLQPYRG